MTSAEFVSELKPLLEARAGLAGVTVHLTDTADVTAPAIVLIRSRVQHDINWVAMGPEREDEVTIPGYVVTKSDVMQTAANQAAAICTEIGTQVMDAPPQVGAQTLKAELSSIAWVPFPADKGGWQVDCEFDLTFTADLA